MRQMWVRIGNDVVLTSLVKEGESFRMDIPEKYQRVRAIEIGAATTKEPPTHDPRCIWGDTMSHYCSYLEDDGD
jgi:hypothetical protein